MSRLRDSLLDVLGSRVCVRCGFADKRALNIDHINGGGNQDKKRFGGKYGSRFVLYYIRHPEEARRKLQVLCSNCNQIKKIENGECVGRTNNNEII